MIFSVIKKEILQNFRDKKAMFWMILFPIIMIFILGNSLSQLFGKSDLEVPKSKVVYSITKESNESKKIEDFFNDSKEDLNMEFSKEDNKEQILEDIRRGKFDCYLEIKDDENIVVYSNNIKDFNAALVTNLLNIYTERNNTVKSIEKKNEIGLQFVEFEDQPSYVEVKSLDKKDRPTALDYYSVTMLTMIILYSTLTGAMTILGERSRKTMSRLSCSPVNRFSLFLGKLIGAVFIVSLQVGILFLFTKYIFKANWGNNLLPIIAILFTLIIFAVSLGMGLARTFKNPNLISAFSNIIIVFLNFLGGAYIPLESFGQNNVLLLIGKISPLKWSNDAIFKIIYSNDTSHVLKAITINLAVAMFFMLISAIKVRREEV